MNLSSARAQLNRGPLATHEIFPAEDSMTSTDPWAEFRRRWRPYYIALVVWIASLSMFASERLFHIWQRVAVPFFLVVMFLYFRISFLDCPRCGQPFYWPTKLVWRRCVHCGLKQYAPLGEISPRP
jgi:hypothetical protein